MSRIQAITFDADQTLWDFHDVQRRALAATVDAMLADGIHPRFANPAALQASRNQIVQSYQGRPHSLEEVRCASFAEVLSRSGHHAPDERARELTDLYLAIRYNDIQLYPDVEAVLQQLAPRYKLGLLSNGNTDPVRCGLPHTFDAIVLGPDHGIEKPDPASFRLIATQLGVEPGRTVHVGDDIDDVDGANGVGAVAVHIDRLDSRPSFAANADYVVRDLVGLLDVLAEIDAAP